jgi:hypothetical protein
VGVFPRQTVLMSENNWKSAEFECWECNTTFSLSTQADVSSETVGEWLLEDLKAEGWVEDDTLADRYGFCGECAKVNA